MATHIVSLVRCEREEGLGWETLLTIGQDGSESITIPVGFSLVKNLGRELALSIGLFIALSRSEINTVQFHGPLESRILLMSKGYSESLMLPETPVQVVSFYALREAR